ncbi:hypothetical protein ICN49_00945 [Polynucleobacter sp. MWH-Mekk-B1]|uniref:hypothetical protein n=1 Tax=Polynucleobacter finlandensis TaxID=1855894 RepID=UPI001C0B936B|nr:hypothetical protein [Polynucleobacter finlandensis]MBU3543475.1 hypothetical protein [Polynucleobacter finlandensis]
MTEHTNEELEAMLTQAKEDLRIEKMRSRFNRIFAHRKAQTYLTRPNSVPFDEEIFHRKVTYLFDNATVEIEYLYDEVWGSGKLQFFRYDSNLQKVDIEEEIELEEDECQLFEKMFRANNLVLDNRFL